MELVKGQVVSFPGLPIVLDMARFKVLSDNQLSWFSMVTSGSQWLLVVSSGSQWLPVVLSGY